MEPIDERYFKWLYRQLAPVRITNPDRTYWSLLAQLHSTQFHWHIPNDDNRAEDGLELRTHFYNETGIEHDPDWFALECSLLEMMVAVSRRLSFYGEGASRDWFWEMVNNLELADWTDSKYHGKHMSGWVEAILSRMIDRSYERNGRGGLFPLKKPIGDQRKVELWDQMNSYLVERMG